jgi:hypothetical protein
MMKGRGFRDDARDRPRRADVAASSTRQAPTSEGEILKDLLKLLTKVGPPVACLLLLLLAIWWQDSQFPAGGRHVGRTEAITHAAGAHHGLTMDFDAQPWPVHDESLRTKIAQFQDPFYAFLVAVTEGDSLGIWTQRRLQAFLADCGKESRLPLEHIQSLERRPAMLAEAEQRRGQEVARIWRVTLDEPMDFTLPYSILGYEPGSVSFARVITFSEWRLGACNIHAPGEGTVSVIPVTDLTIFRLDSGWIVLDIDGWLDKLLGCKLDDCWTQGFAICRQDGRFRALALSCNRQLKPICGEFDFYTIKVTPLGSPVGRGMHVYVRPWVLPPEGMLASAWRYVE